jgi:hypothetical protein
MEAASITNEELMAQAIAAVKAKGIELGQPLPDEDGPAFVAALTGLPLGQILPPDKGKGKGESQADVDEMLGQVRDMPKEVFEMFKMMAGKGAGKGEPGDSMEAASITNEELMAQAIAAVKAKGNELGQPLPDEDGPAFVAALTGLPLGQILPPDKGKGKGKSQADFDEMLGQVRDMPKEVFEMFKMMAGKGAGKGKQGDSMEAFSITAEELVDQTIIVLKARAGELGHPLSDEDAAVVGKAMGESRVTLPESQSELDENLGKIKEMPKEPFEQAIEMFKMMAAKGADKGN